MVAVEKQNKFTHSRATSITLNSCKGTNLSISLIQQNKSNVWLGFKCWPSNGESI